MTNLENAKLEKDVENIVKYFEKAKDNPELLEEIGNNPLTVLRSMNIDVEDEFKEVVSMQLKATTSTIPNQTFIKEAEAMSEEAHKILRSVQEVKLMSAPSAPTGLTVEIDKEEKSAPEPVLNAMELSVRPWGVVLVVREPAIKYIQGGGQITGGVLGAAGGIVGLAGLSVALGPLGIVVGAVLALIGAALGIYSAVISMVDEGKGDYLNWTWAQFIPMFLIIPNPMYGVPVITAIK